jgi:hypothetical protein
MRILRREHEVILMGPTGAAADNIGGNTIHTALDWSEAKPDTSTEDPMTVGKQNNYDR